MNKVVLITGAGSGIGKAVAEQLHGEGYVVIGTSRKPIDNRPYEVLPLDLNDAESIDGLVNRVLKSHNRIDVLINNAGYDLYGSFEGTSDKEIQDQLRVNFLGAVRMTKAVLPLLRMQATSYVINISSIGGLLALPMNSAYSASKFALEGFFESARYELARLGIRVVSVLPQSVRTESLGTSISSISMEIHEYKPALDQMVDLMRQEGARSKITPERVAAKISRILKTKKPKYRYTVGPLVSFMRIWKGLFPQIAFERMIAEKFLLIGGGK